MNKLITKLITSAFFLSLAYTAFAADLETNNMQDVEQVVIKLNKQFGPKRVLVVFDIDNTLLALDKAIGSDPWFAWQSNKLKNGLSEHLVADTYSGLLEALNKVYALSPTRLTQPDAGKVVARIQKAGNPTIALTARNASSRDSTERELKRAGIWFAESGIGQAAGFVGAYAPYNLDYLGLSGISQQEAQLWGLSKPRPVTYVNGLMMVAGQHKGAMLRTLLHKTHRKFDAIVFVDDKHKNTENMEQGFIYDTLDPYTVRYSGEDENVRRFEEGDKAEAIAQWKQLSIGLRVFD